MNDLHGGGPASQLLSRSDVLDVLAGYVSRGEGARVVIAKLEGMKAFNHAHGVRLGDDLLQIVGGRFVHFASRYGHVGCLHGDVFLIVLPYRSGRDVEPQIEMAAQVCSRPVAIGGIEVIPRLRVGLATTAPGGGDIDQLLIEASAAMRSAESLSAESSSAMVVTADQNIRDRAHIETVVDRDLADALASDALGFAFQPLVTLEDSAVHGAEALLRWRHPEIGLISPPLIIERAQANGLTRRLNQWSVERLTSDWSTFLDGNDARDGMSVSMNFSETQLADRECASIVRDGVRASGLELDQVLIEVVESGRVGDAAEATLRALAEAGATIVLDDFGTGFNALEYFLRFPVHCIKFDRSLTHSVATNETSLVIVSGVTEIADRLGVATVGEGIETPADSDMCRGLGLTFGQGWHFGRPMTLSDFGVMADRNRAERDQSALERTSLAGKNPRATPRARQLSAEPER